MDKESPRFTKRIVATAQASDDAQSLLVAHSFGDITLTQDQRYACERVRDSFLWGQRLYEGDIECLHGVGAFKQDQWGK